MMIPALLILLVSSSEKARPEWQLGGQEDVFIMREEIYGMVG